MPGYISLHRDIQKHWLYEEKRIYSRYEAWLDILMRVNHSEGKVTHNGTVEIVLRGSTIWSMGDMEEHWGWSNKKVKRFLLCLADDQMLSVKSTTKKTYLTVLNYDKYQGSDIDKAPPMPHQSTAEAFQKHNESIQTIITNNLNNNLKDSTTTTADAYESVGDVHLKVFKTISMTGLMTGLIKRIKDKGHSDDFLKELMLEAGESANGVPNIRFIETIYQSWEEKNINSRDEAKTDRDKRTNNVHSFKNRQNKTGPSGKPSLPIIQDGPKTATYTDEKREEMRRKARLLDGKKDTGTE